jgi:hypothetical protein
MSKPEREREARDVIRRSGADTKERFNQVEAVNLGVTFHQQAEWWLNYIQTRKRNPVKPKTAASWKDCLKKWLNPNLGDMPLSSVKQSRRERVGFEDGGGRSVAQVAPQLCPGGEDGCRLGCQ